MGIQNVGSTRICRGKRDRPVGSAVKSRSGVGSSGGWTRCTNSARPLARGCENRYRVFVQYIQFRRLLANRRQRRNYSSPTDLLQMMPVSTSAVGVRHLEVTSDHAGQRLDNFLLRELKGAPKSLIYRIVRKGEVRLNGGRVQPDYRLQSGDVVRIPPVRLAEESPSFRPAPALIERLRAAVLHEDREVLVLDKPAGLAVHKGSGLPYGLIEVLRAVRPGEAFLELAHRLDRETSGCLMLAKTPATLRRIQEAFRAGQVEKRYLVLMRGYWNHGPREVNLPLRRNVLRGGERMVEVLDDGKPSRTRFRPVSLGKRASLLEADIATGRTHQIRVHAAHIEHPVAGDEKYGDAAFNQIMVEQCGLRRLFLHAHSLNISLGGRDLAISAPLDAELKDVLDRLRLVGDGEA
jgi:23S rRNA pseudouridine955/2504/2580 synthase